MENNCCRLEQSTLISELVQGKGLAEQLRAQLSEKPCMETRKVLVQGILSSYEKALLILKWSGPMVQAPTVTAPASLPESPISASGSPQSDDFEAGLRDCQDHKQSSKKRKTLPRWTEHVIVSTETGLEGPHEDGYSWRKYGQKDILGAKYPRSYYRCTFRNSQNCFAVKQVQRSDDNPFVFEITYRGQHTCTYGGHSVQSLPSAENNELSRNQRDNRCPQQKQPETLINYRDSLRINTDEMGGNKERESIFCFPSTSFGRMGSGDNGFAVSAVDESTRLGSLSHSTISPATGETNYLLSPCDGSSFGRLHEVSAPDSPILALDLPLPHLDEAFPYDIHGFFS